MEKYHYYQPIPEDYYTPNGKPDYYWDGEYISEDEYQSRINSFEEECAIKLAIGENYLEEGDLSKARNQEDMLEYLLNA